MQNCPGSTKLCEKRLVFADMCAGNGFRLKNKYVRETAKIGCALFSNLYQYGLNALLVELEELSSGVAPNRHSLFSHVVVCKIPLLARALGLKAYAAARPSAIATIGYLVYKSRGCHVVRASWSRYHDQELRERLSAAILRVTSSESCPEIFG